MFGKACSKIFLIAFFFVCIVVIKRFCYRQTDGFALSKIRSTLNFPQPWADSSFSTIDQDGLTTILNQPYYYLAKGAQAYVFLSEDQQTVIKFFRLYHLLPPMWAIHLHFPLHFEGLRLRKIAQKKEELEKDFQSYVLAYHYLKEETGLLFVHLNKSENLFKKLTLYDKLNIAHQVDLDQMEFVVQQKATLLYPAMEELIHSQGMEASKKAISSLLHLLVKRCRLGIIDKDPDLNTNFGFLCTTPVQIDVGRFRIERSEGGTPQVSQSYREELFRITDNFRQWLDTKSPELASYLIQEIQTFEPL